jgi:PTH2 family peptidyl-tRNA hydrolase
MSDTQTKVIVYTTIASFFSGFFLGIYAIRGYIISPSLVAEREASWKDPVESEESDIDEDDTILDHAPNWSNGEAADRKQGLRVEKKVKKVVEEEVAPPRPTETDEVAVDEGKAGEECKLVLVVRTDLGMTKGLFFPSHPLFWQKG